TIRPAPIFVWPTSELPIRPSGSPTSCSLACRWACGQRVVSRRQLGVRALSIALSSAFGRSPHPSRMHSTSGRGREGEFIFANLWQQELICIRETGREQRAFLTRTHPALAGGVTPQSRW